MENRQLAKVIRRKSFAIKGFFVLLQHSGSEYSALYYNTLYYTVCVWHYLFIVLNKDTANII